PLASLGCVNLMQMCQVLSWREGLRQLLPSSRRRPGPIAPLHWTSLGMAIAYRSRGFAHVARWAPAFAGVTKEWAMVDFLQKPEGRDGYCGTKMPCQS